MYPITHYRGYNIHKRSTKIFIYHKGSLVDTSTSIAWAKKTIDRWLDAR